MAVGPHTVKIVAVDSQGNVDPTPATFSWTVVQLPSHTTITSATDGNSNTLQSGGSTLSPSITFNVQATAGTNPLAGFQCSLDNGPTSSCNTPVTYNSLSTGQHTFKVQAVDSQGNVDPTPATFSWTILTPIQGAQNIIDIINE